MQTTIPIWLAVVVPLGSALIPAGAVLLSQYMTNNSQREQRAQQRDLKEMELEEAKQQRLREDRRKAYISLARAAATVNPNEEYTLTELAEGFAEIELVGGSDQAIRHARDLSTRSREVRAKARRVKLENKDPAEDEDVREALELLRNARSNFIKAAREDIGHPPDTVP